MTGPAREGVHQLRRVPLPDIRQAAYQVRGNTHVVEPPPHAAGARGDPPHRQRGPGRRQEAVLL